VIRDPRSELTFELASGEETYLSGVLQELAVHGEVSVAKLAIFLPCPPRDGFYCEFFVLGDIEVLDLATLDVALVPRRHIPEVPDRNCVVGRAVQPRVDCQEGVDLPLGAELSAELAGGKTNRSVAVGCHDVVLKSDSGLCLMYWGEYTLKSFHKNFANQGNPLTC
jgi:hypothetical protein